MTDFNSSAESLFSSEDTVFIKQEVVPPAYLSEGDDEGGHELGNWNGNMRGQQDSDSDEEADSVEEGSTVSDDDSSDGEPLLDPLTHRHPPTASQTRMLVSRTALPAAMRKAPGPTLPGRTDEHKDFTNGNEDPDDDGDGSSDDTDGEIKLPMIRLWYPSQMSFPEVERSRQIIVKLLRLPPEILSKGPGANFSKEELEKLKLDSRPKPTWKGREEFQRQQHRPGPKSRTKSPVSLVPKSKSYNSLTCERCGRTFTRPSGLKYHMEHVHIDSPAAAAAGLLAQAQSKHVCEVCGKSFTKRLHLVTHSQTHTGVPLFSCRVTGCNRTFNGWTTRRMHELKCGAPPEPAVQIVDQATSIPVPVVSFPADGTGANYGIVIDGDKILLKRPASLAKAKPNSVLPAPEDEDVGRKQCRYCKHTFRTAAGCRQHEFRHEGIKVFKCTHEGCAAAFSTPISLTEHVRMVHTGETPYKCMFEGCGMAFGRVLTFKHHIRSKHLNTKYPCPTCGKVFTMKGTLDRHEKIHTGLRPHLCQECGMSFRAAYNLKLHSKVHLNGNPGKPPRRPRGSPGSGKTPRDWSRRRPPKQRYDEFGNVIPKEYPYKCSVAGCSKAFMRPWNLEAHAREKHGVSITASVGPGLDTDADEPRKRKQGQPLQAQAATAGKAMASTSAASSPDSQFSQQHQPQPLLSQSEYGYGYGYDPRAGPSFYSHDHNPGPVNMTVAMAMPCVGPPLSGGQQRYWSSGSGGGGGRGHGHGQP